MSSNHEIKLFHSICFGYINPQKGLAGLNIFGRNCYHFISPVGILLEGCTLQVHVHFKQISYIMVNVSWLYFHVFLQKYLH